MTEKSQETIYRWLPTIIALLGCLATVGVAWGSIIARVAAVEVQAKESITRFEYNELVKRLDRIEIKLDQELRRKQSLDLELERIK